MAPAGATIQAWPNLEDLRFIDHPYSLAMAGRLLIRRFPGAPGARNLQCYGFTKRLLAGSGGWVEWLLPTQSGPSPIRGDRQRPRPDKCMVWDLIALPPNRGDVQDSC